MSGAKTILSHIKSSKLFRSTFYSITSGVGGQLLLIISGPFIARLLGVEGRGYFAAISVWAFVFSTVGNLGIPAACAYYLSTEPQRISQILSECYHLALRQIVVLAPLLGFILFFWSFRKPVNIQRSIYPALLIIPAMLMQNFAIAILQGQQRFVTLNWVRLLPAALYTTAITVLFILGIHEFMVVVIGWASAYLIAGILMIAIALKPIHIDWCRHKETRRQLLDFGLRGHVGTIAPIDSLRLDQMAASLVISPASLGFYAVGTAFTNLPLFISYGAGLVAYPAIASRSADAGAKNILRRYFWGVTLINVILCTVLILLMPFLIPLLFGKDFTPAVPLAQILLVGTTFASSRKILVEGIRGLGFPQVSTIAEISMYPWLLTAGAYLLFHYDVLGLSYAVSIAYALSLIFALLLWRSLKQKRISMA